MRVDRDAGDAVMLDYILGADKRPVRLYPGPSAHAELAALRSAIKDAQRTVAVTEVAEGVRVLTEFLFLDYQWGQRTPEFFETRVIGGPLDEEQRRYATYDEALAGHARMAHLVRAALWAAFAEVEVA